MKTFFAVLVVVSPLAAFARPDLTVCTILADALNRQEARFEQAKFVLQNVDTVCEDGPANCRERAQKEFDAASASYLKAKKNFKDAECEDLR